MSTPTTCPAAAWLLVLAGCAAADRPQRQDVAFVVDTPHQIGRIEFSSDAGGPFDIALVPPGITIYELRLRPARYCLEGLATGDLNVGLVTTQRAVPCFDVIAGADPYAGHLLVGTDLRISWAYDLERWRLQQDDPDVMRVSN